MSHASQNVSWWFCLEAFWSRSWPDRWLLCQDCTLSSEQYAVLQCHGTDRHYAVWVTGSLIRCKSTSIAHDLAILYCGFGNLIPLTSYLQSRPTPFEPRSVQERPLSSGITQRTPQTKVAARFALPCFTATQRRLMPQPSMRTSPGVIWAVALKIHGECPT